MRVFYITGTSRGLGFALANELLKSEDHLVIGIGRKTEIVHPNYRHKILDLGDTIETSKFQFGQHLKAQEVFLINNAGTLGEIKHVGNLNNVELTRAFNVNLLAPCILMNNFARDYQKDKEVRKTILNISSGAAVSAYDGWSAYCTSKAGLNMFGEVLNLENSIEGKESFRVLNIAPGIIETRMQEQIRKSDKADFSNLERFVELKENDHLQTPEETANRLIDLLNSPIEGEEVFQDLRV